MNNAHHLQCHIHKDEIYTNFCCVKNCLTPLCPECIDDHIKEHRMKGEFPEIDTLRRVKRMCSKQVNHGIETITEELDRLEQYNDMSVDEIIEKGSQELSATRDKMHKVIDHYFNNIQQEYVSSIKLNIGKFFDFGDLMEELECLLGELRRVEEELESTNLIEGIQRVSSLDMKQMVLTYQEKVDEVLDRRLKVPLDVVFTDDDLRSFEMDLGKYVRVRNKKLKILKDEEEGRASSRYAQLASDEARYHFERKFRQALGF